MPSKKYERHPRSIFLGEHLRDMRKKKGWSQRHAAELLELEPSSFANIEQGRELPSPPMLNKIADVFELPRQQLVKIAERDIRAYLKKKFASQLERDLAKYRSGLNGATADEDAGDLHSTPVQSDSAQAAFSWSASSPMPAKRRRGPSKKELPRTIPSM